MTRPSRRTSQVASDGAEDGFVLVCRSARLTRPAYRFYRDILLSFPARGHAPDAAELADLAARHGISLQATLAQLAVQDLIQRDPRTGAIRAAYPFSGVPTAHRVHLEATSDQPALEVYAMCALDALGIPLMLRRAAEIVSPDALTGEIVRVAVVPSGPVTIGNPPTAASIASAGWRVIWEPPGAVVVARPEGHEHEHEHDGSCEAAGTCCPITNYFTSVAQAQHWIDSQQQTDARVFAQADALRYAARLFAGVLDRLPGERGQ